MVSISRLKKALRLGEDALPGAQEPTEADLEMQRRLDGIIGGLSPEQQEHVLAELEDPEVMGPGGRSMSRLTREILNLAIGNERPGVMHPDVALVYREDPRAVPLHDCADCGLGIPCVAGGKTGGRTIPFRRYFDACPACGGEVGYNAYWRKQREAVA